MIVVFATRMVVAFCLFKILIFLYFYAHRRAVDCTEISRRHTCDPGRVSAPTSCARAADCSSTTNGHIHYRNQKTATCSRVTVPPTEPHAMRLPVPPREQLSRHTAETIHAQRVPLWVISLAGAGFPACQMCAARLQMRCIGLSSWPSVTVF